MLSGFCQQLSMLCQQQAFTEVCHLATSYDSPALSPEDRAVLHYQWAQALMQLKDYRLAITKYSIAEHEFEKADIGQFVFKTQIFKAFCQYYLKKYSESIINFRKIITKLTTTLITLELDEKSFEAELTECLLLAKLYCAKPLITLGENQEAAKLIKEVLQHPEACNHPLVQPSLDNAIIELRSLELQEQIDNVRHMMIEKQFTIAIPALLALLKTAEEKNQQYKIAQLLSVCYEEVGNHSQAETYQQLTSRYQATLDDPRLLAVFRFL